MANRARFLAVIGHADEAALLARCIEHHLAIGMDAVLVVPMRSDEATAAVLRRYGVHERVRAFLPRSGEDVDPDYFTRATEEARRWCDPEWIVYVDSDEFWLCASGTLAHTRGLDDRDLLVAERFNVPPVRNAGDTLRGLDVRAGASLALFIGRGDLERAYRAGDRRRPLVRARDRSPKIMVRADSVANVSYGGHAVELRGSARCAVADDLLVAHAPFTTRERFARKVDGIRDVMRRFPQAFAAGEAWHWRPWLELDAAGLTAEFARQLVATDASGAADAGVVPADEFFARRATFAPRCAIDDARAIAAATATPFTPDGASIDVAVSAAFDAGFARRVYADRHGLAGASDADLFAFYERYVRTFAFAPNALFDEAGYRARYPDVAASIARAGGSALRHFIAFGEAEGRENLTGFDGALSETCAVLGSARLASRVVSWFDDAFYRRFYPDVDAAVTAGVYRSALDHYLEIGRDKGRVPRACAG